MSSSKDCIHLEQKIKDLEQELVECKRQRDSIENERNNLHDILSSINVGLIVHNPDKRVAWVNNIIQEMFSKGNPVGHICYEFFEGRSKPCKNCAVSECFKTGIICNVVNHNQADGRWFHSEAYPLKDEAGRVKQVLESVIDITDHKQAEEALENERFFLSSIIDNIQEAIIICNNEGKITKFNEFARRLHGQPEQPIKPEQWAEYYDLYRSDGSTPLPMEEIPLFRALQGEQFQNVEIVVAPKHTNPKYLLCNGQPLVDEKGGSIGALVAMFDITKRKKDEVELEEREKRFRDIFNTSADGILIFNPEGVIVDANPAAVEMYGYEKDELIGLSGKKIVHPDYYYLFEDFKNQINESGRFQAESVDLRKDGSLFNIEIKGSSFIYYNKPHFLAMVRDITEHKKVLEDLEESRIQYKYLMDNALFPIVISNLKTGQVMYINNCASRFFGVPNEKAIDLRASEYRKEPQDRESFIKKITQAGKIEEKEVELKTNSGKIKSVLISANQIYFQEEKATFSVFQDITKLKNLENTLRKSETRYRGVVEDTPIFICRYLPSGEITFVNQAYCQYFNKKSEELIGTNFLNLLPKADQKTVMEHLSSLTYNSPVKYHEHQVIKPDGNLAWQRWTNRALFNDQGQIVAYQSIGEDINERKRAQEKALLNETRLDALVNLGNMISSPMEELTKFALEEGIKLTGSKIGYLAFFKRG